MKLTSLHKTVFFFLIFFGSLCMNASDTLKIKTIRFFIEPKATYFIPKQSPDAYKNIFVASGANIMIGCGFPNPNVTTKTTWQNQSPVANVGISGGTSVRLCKYFSYELSLAYYHYSLKYKATETGTDMSSGEHSTKTYNWNYTSNALYISNGLSFKCKNFILTNSVMVGMNFPAHSSTYLIYSPSPYLMSEHKIGYSLCKNRIEPYVGINVLDNFHNAIVMPFASVRVVF